MKEGKMKEIIATFSVAIIIIALFVYGLNVADKSGFDNGYRSGQIDALTGNIRYRLVVKPDSTRVWEKGKSVVAGLANHSDSEYHFVIKNNK